MSKQTKQALVPKLRFPEFLDGGEWEVDKLDNLINTVTPPQKLQTALYQTEGKFPIIDQSQSYICGWTDNQDALIVDDLPLIIFGDHTCALKIVYLPFAQGADGIKILKTKEQTETNYLYQYLQFNPVVMEEYRRHFSILKEKLIAFPRKKSGEQQKIADFLSSIDELITAQTQKLDGLKIHKKGLLQQLFPAEGENLPQLRFPEFLNAGEWEEKKFGELCKFIRGPFGGALKKEIFVEDGYAIYEQSHAIHRNFNSFRYYISEEKFDELKRFSVQPNDIIMSCSGTMGKFAIVPEGSKKGVINQALLKLTVKKGQDLQFIKAVVELPINQEKLLSQSAGGAIKNVVSVGQIKEIGLHIPGFQEQQKIADCLSSIDELIVAFGQKIDALKAHKKGLMQQLFPAVDEVDT